MKNFKLVWKKEVNRTAMKTTAWDIAEEDMQRNSNRRVRL